VHLETTVEKMESMGQPQIHYISSLQMAPLMTCKFFFISLKNARPPYRLRFQKINNPFFSKHSPNVGDTAEFMVTVSFGNVRYLDASPSASTPGNSRLLPEICRLYWSTTRNLLDR
jgi:hypothetical protein